MNIQDDSTTVVGIGDMAGDVFGNGMLMSNKMELVAAFNHLHIFIDPYPDPTVSYWEKRLFDLPRSSWEDYNKKNISSGGGVFSRQIKKIRISTEMKGRFLIDQEFLTPNELIKKILEAPVDLLWNGGIGTYIKSSSELNSDVGDKSNDNVRINGKDLRVKVIGEGGNLGITQLGRVEYSLKGGACNTDFIDNVGGVDCSDHEVNIKILLNEIISKGDLTYKQRNKILSDMTTQVSQLVLNNNYKQTQSLSLSLRRSKIRSSEYEQLISKLVSSGRLDRELEFIPSNSQLKERYLIKKFNQS